MAKYVSVIIDKGSNQYSPKYQKSLMSHLSNEGLDLTDEIELSNKITLDYDAEDIISWNEFISNTLEKFPEVKEEFEEGNTSTIEGGVGEYQEYSRLLA